MSSDCTLTTRNGANFQNKTYEGFVLTAVGTRTVLISSSLFKDNGKDGMAVIGTTSSKTVSISGTTTANSRFGGNSAGNANSAGLGIYGTAAITVKAHNTYIGFNKYGGLRVTNPNKVKLNFGDGVVDSLTGNLTLDQNVDTAGTGLAGLDSTHSDHHDAGTTVGVQATFFQLALDPSEGSPNPAPMGRLPPAGSAMSPFTSVGPDPMGFPRRMRFRFDNGANSAAFSN
jgi:hypothetical protein